VLSDLHQQLSLRQLVLEGGVQLREGSRLCLQREPDLSLIPAQQANGQSDFVGPRAR
jgi:hypothetical protein